MYTAFIRTHVYERILCTYQHFRKQCEQIYIQTHTYKGIVNILYKYIWTLRRQNESLLNFGIKVTEEKVYN